jgi:hypothetical protein
MFREDLLLKAGVIMITLALALAIVAVVVSVALRSVPEQAVASESSTKTSTKSSVEPLIRDESPYEPWVEKARTLPASNAAGLRNNLHGMREGRGRCKSGRRVLSKTLSTLRPA